jgi:poly(A) polymerase
MMNKKSIFPVFYDQILECIGDSGGYLVGGAVRDLLLNKPVHDLDFCLPSKTVYYARKVADDLQGDFFVLDEERETARVLIKNNGQRFVVDFTLFQGNSIEEDLSERDFTITSMALDILGDQKILDPFNGAQDLKDKVIRSTSNEALQNDPLRCLRAVRLAAQMDFLILPDTLKQIRLSQQALTGVSSERIRDEIFRILDGPNQSAALKVLDKLGTFSIIFPGDFTESQNRITGTLERFWSLLLEPHDQDSAASWSLGLFVGRLGRFRADIKNHLAHELVFGRSVYHLSFLAAFLKISDNEGIKNLPLSNQEIDRLSKTSLASKQFKGLSALGNNLSPIEVYRYFRSFGKAGVEGIFLGLADIHGTILSLGGDVWIVALDSARYILEGWWSKRAEWVDPPVLVNGHDLIKKFNLTPGPQVGELLEDLRESQVRDGLNSRKEALALVGKRLSSSEERLSE